MHYIRAFLILSCTVIVYMLRKFSPVTLQCCSYRRRKHTELSESWCSENLIFYQTVCKKPVRPHDNMIRRMQDTEGYWHTLICDTYCFSTAIVVTRTRLLLRTLLVLVALPLVSVAVRRTTWADPQNIRTEDVFTCVLHSEASNTSAWYVPIIQVATCIKCSMVTCGTPESRIRLVRAFDLSYLLFCIYSLYQDRGSFRELTDRLPRTDGISLHRFSPYFSSSGSSVQTNVELTNSVEAVNINTAMIIFIC
jgi:hypothetical protein